MKEKSQNGILDAIEKVVDKSKDCKLEASVFTELDNELSLLANYFRKSKLQSFLISIFFSFSLKNKSMDMDDIINFLDCNPVKMAKINSDFDELVSSSLFSQRKKNYRYYNYKHDESEYLLTKKVVRAILNEKDIYDIKQNDDIKSIFDLLEKLNELSKELDDEQISSNELFLISHQIIKKYDHFPLIQEINKLKLTIEDCFFFTYIVWETISGHDEIDLSDDLKYIFDDIKKRFSYTQSILSKENELVKNNLIETFETVFFNDLQVKLTDYAYELLWNCEIKFHKTIKKKENVFVPANLPERKLIYNEAEMQQLFLLKETFQEDKLLEIQEQLDKKNLAKGITALLYGFPGTGKTEFVKQIAKETNRKLMKVEISQAKSAWYGESEKQIEKIFTEYKKLKKECKKTPILLFNEADAIISKRKNAQFSDVSNTENAMQNILLEELENFEGILIATTNLANNFDTAFERRFLFKIKFEKPNTDIKARIWKLKFPFLEQEDCYHLASSYDFSGGQIDNILRKYEVHQIIYGQAKPIQEILRFCKEETLTEKTNKIGFTKI